MSTNNKCWKGGRQKETLLHCLQECKLVQPVWRTAWGFFQKLKIKLPFNPAIPFLDIYLEETMIQRSTCIPMFTAALFIRAKTWNQPKCPSPDEWIKEM